MAFKLSKAEAKLLQDTMDALETAKNDLEEAHKTYEEERTEVFTALKEVVDKYNEALEKARDLRDELVGRLQGEFDEKSEKWAEGDKGSAAQAMIEAWESADLDDLEVVDPESIDPPDASHEAILSELPTEAE